MHLSDIYLNLKPIPQIYLYILPYSFTLKLKTIAIIDIGLFFVKIPALATYILSVQNVTRDDNLHKESEIFCDVI